MRLFLTRILSVRQALPRGIRLPRPVRQAQSLEPGSALLSAWQTCPCSSSSRGAGRPVAVGQGGHSVLPHGRVLAPGEGVCLPRVQPLGLQRRSWAFGSYIPGFAIGHSGKGTQALPKVLSA